MTNIRKMITFPPRGHELLRAATADGRELATGLYLTAVLLQRYRAWTAALDSLVRHGYTRADVLETLQSYRDRDPGHLGPELRVLLLEFEAGNQALVAALQETD